MSVIDLKTKRLLELKDFSGVPFKKERVYCQFKWDGCFWKAHNDGARDFLKLVSCVGIIGEARLRQCEAFIEVERIWK